MKKVYVTRSMYIPRSLQRCVSTKSSISQLTAQYITALITPGSSKYVPVERDKINVDNMIAVRVTGEMGVCNLRSSLEKRFAEEAQQPPALANTTLFENSKIQRAFGRFYPNVPAHSVFRTELRIYSRYLVVNMQVILRRVFDMIPTNSQRFIRVIV